MSIHENELDGTTAETDDDGAEIKLGDLEALRGVVKFASRIKCATLAWNTLAIGLDDARPAATVRAAPPQRWAASPRQMRER